MPSAWLMGRTPKMLKTVPQSEDEEKERSRVEVEFEDVSGEERRR